MSSSVALFDFIQLILSLLCTARTNRYRKYTIVTKQIELPVWNVTFPFLYFFSIYFQRLSE